MSFHGFWVREDGVEYDEARRKAAGQKAIIYYLVAAYIGYMGYSILRNRLTGDATMSYPLAIALTSVLILGALAVALYATLRMKKEYEKSRLEITENNEEQN